MEEQRQLEGTRTVRQQVDRGGVAPLHLGLRAPSNPQPLHLPPNPIRLPLLPLPLGILLAVMLDWAAWMAAT